MNQDNFLTTIQTHQKSLFTIAFQYCGNRQDAEDIVQDVFLKLYTAKNSFSDEQHLHHWLIRVTINRCKDFLRNPFRRLRASFEDAEKVLHSPYETDHTVFDAVMSLPLKYREVVMLYYYEGYPILEISTLLHRKESTVQTQLMRARALLKERLKEVWENETQ